MVVEGKRITFSAFQSLNCQFRPRILRSIFYSSKQIHFSLPLLRKRGFMQHNILLRENHKLFAMSLPFTIFNQFCWSHKLSSLIRASTLISNKKEYLSFPMPFYLHKKTSPNWRLFFSFAFERISCMRIEKLKKNSQWTLGYCVN